MDNARGYVSDDVLFMFALNQPEPSDSLRNLDASVNLQSRFYCSLLAEHLSGCASRSDAKK
jgi:hypothetical protein